MRFGQLLEYNMKNSFLKKSYRKCGGETISRHFSKKSKLRISPDQYPKVLYSLFLLCGKWGLSKYIETKLQTTCFYLILKLVSLIFGENYLFCYILYLWDIGQYVYCNCFLTKLWCHEFWSQPYLSNQAVAAFYMWPKRQDKSLNILSTKRAFKIK